jgi:hypothetical protein
MQAGSDRALRANRNFVLDIAGNDSGIHQRLSRMSKAASYGSD